MSATAAKSVAEPLIAEYKLINIEKTKSPTGDDDGKWYKYVVDNGRSEITAYCRGNKKEVQQETSRFVKQLNERMASARSPYWASRTKSAKKTAKKK